MAWNWNYYTLENMCTAKCSLCDHNERPIIHIEEFLYDHIRCETDICHKIAFKLIKEIDSSEIIWDDYYETVQSTRNMFSPEVICKCCMNVMPIQGTEIRKQAFIKASPEMTSHLKDKHGVDEKNWMPLKSGILKHAGDYCKVPKLGMMYKCKKCYEIQGKNGIMFVKHLFEKHRCDGELDEFPWTNIPNELNCLYSIVGEDTTLSDIADRPGSSRQGSSGVSSESTQSSRKRKEKVLKKMSEFEISTQIEEPLYKRRKSSSTGDSD